MTQFTQNAQDTETSSQYAGIRLAELIDQDWNRNKSAKLAMLEGISLSDQSGEAADRLAIERGEDDGMIICQDVTASAHNRRNLNDITAR